MTGVRSSIGNLLEHRPRPVARSVIVLAYQSAPSRVSLRPSFLNLHYARYTTRAAWAWLCRLSCVCPLAVFPPWSVSVAACS